MLKYIDDESLRCGPLFVEDTKKEEARKMVFLIVDYRRSQASNTRRLSHNSPMGIRLFPNTYADSAHNH